MLIKISADDILKYFSYFSQKIGFGSSCNMSYGDNLHEMPKSIFWENKKNIVSLSSAEFAQRVVMVKILSSSLACFC